MTNSSMKMFSRHGGPKFTHCLRMLSVLSLFAHCQCSDCPVDTVWVHTSSECEPCPFGTLTHGATGSTSCSCDSDKDLKMTSTDVTVTSSHAEGARISAYQNDDIYFNIYRQK